MKFEKYLLNELTKTVIFKDILSTLTKDDFMGMPEINKKRKVISISTQGYEAHIQVLVRKGKVKETMSKGKDLYKKA